MTGESAFSGGSDNQELTQQSLTGKEPVRVTCEYYDGCHGGALYIAEILHYGEGEKPVRMCQSCADEHAEQRGVEYGDDIQRLKPADRYVEDAPEPDPVFIVVTAYVDDPHPHIEGVFQEREPADSLMDECQDMFSQPHPDAWTLYKAVPGGEFEVLDP